MLSVERGHGLWHPNLQVSSPLRHVTNLQVLRISLDVLLGWNHCEHHYDSASSRPPVLPEQLARLLPDTLEALTLDLEEFHWYCNG